MMSNQAGKWETVVKKKGPVSKSDVKKAQQKFYDNVTHQQFEETTKNPLQETTTIYKTFDASKDNNSKATSSSDKENVNQDKYPTLLHSSFPSPGKGKSQANVKGNQVKKKGTKPPKPDPLYAAVDGLKKLNGSDLHDILKNIKEKFPNHPIVWLQDVVSWLQMQVDGPVEKDLALRDQEQEFPSNQLPSDVTKVLQDVFQDCSSGCLFDILVFCITTMLSRVQQGKSTIGFRAFCQLLIKNHPTILHGKISEILSGKNNTIESYQILIWIFSQNFDNLRHCLQVWWKVMYPVLKVRHHTVLAVGFLEKVLRRHEAEPKAEPYLQCSEFLVLLESTFSSTSPVSHTPSAKRTLVELYPLVKDLLFTDDVSKHCANYFKFFLRSLKTEDIVVKAELLTLLLMCLRHDHRSFDVWKKLFHSTLVESSILLDYIAKNQAMVKKMLNAGSLFKSKVVLEDVFRNFLAILIDMHHKGEGSKPGFAESYHVCKIIITLQELIGYEELNLLLSKEPSVRFSAPKKEAKQSSSMLWRLLKYSSIIGLLILSTDLFVHRGWQGSKGQKLAVDTGLDVFAERAINCTQDFGAKSQSWLAKNVPYYYSNVHPHVERVMETTRVYVVNASIYIYEKSEPARIYLNENVPIVFEKVENVLTDCWTVLSTQAIRVWELSFPYIKQGLEYGKYFVFTVLPKVKENIVRSWLNLVETTYNLNPDFFNKVSVMTVTYWEKTMEYTPVLIEKIRESLAAVLRSISGFLQQEQS